MRLVKRIGNCDHHLQRLVQLKRSAREQLRQRLAFKELADNEIRCRILMPDIDDGADSRVIQRRDRLRVALESRLYLRMGRELRRENLQRDDLLTASVRCLIAFVGRCTNGLDDFIQAKPCAGFEGHRDAPNDSTLRSSRGRR